MNTKRKITYSIQDAFKSLEMLEDEEVVRVEAPTAPDILTEQVEKEEVVKDKLNMAELDKQIEEFTARLYKLKEAYDKNPKSLTEEEVRELQEANLIEDRQAINVKDKDEVEQALNNLTQKDEEENIELIVDVDAESEEDLKDNYIGNFILQCNVCKTLIYKEPEEIVYSEDEEDESVNYEEECPHCKSTDGFIIIGKVAPINEIEDEEEEIEKDEVDSETDELKAFDDDKELENKDEAEEDTEEDKKPKVEESMAQSFQLEIDEIDDKIVNKLITKYLHEIYENVDTFETFSGKIDEDLNRLTLEGDIKFKSGKKLTTTFIFEAFEITKKGKVRFVGKNETLSTAKKPFTLVTSINDKKLIIESFTYNYSIKIDEELKRIYGRIV